jgi:ABC-type nitrate/sulfonate/bicarbonate transport system substrate-binding protein
MPLVSFAFTWKCFPRQGGLLISKLVLVVLAIGWFAATAPIAAGADKLNFAYSAIAGAQAIPWITKEAGLFEKHGVDIQMIYIDGGPRAAQALLAGDVSIAQVGGSAPVAARLRGGDIVTLAGLMNALAFSLIVHPDIQRPEQLKGKSLAVSRLGSISDYASRKILTKWGLRPDRDVMLLQIPGGSPVRLAAVQSGMVAGMVGQPPLTTMARRAKLHILAEPQDFGAAYPNTVISAQHGYVKRNRRVIRNFHHAIIEGIRVYKRQADFSKKVIAKYMRISDTAAIEDSYAFFSRLVPIKPYPSLEAIKEALIELQETEPKARSAQPEDFVDMSVVKAIDDSGFIEDLYKTKN